MVSLWGSDGQLGLAPSTTATPASCRVTIKRKHSVEVSSRSLAKTFRTTQGSERHHRQLGIRRQSIDPCMPNMRGYIRWRTRSFPPSRTNSTCMSEILCRPGGPPTVNHTLVHGYTWREVCSPFRYPRANSMPRTVEVTTAATRLRLTSEMDSNIIPPEQGSVIGRFQDTTISKTPSRGPHPIIYNAPGREDGE